LFGWRIQPESASHNSIFLSREISQPFSQQYFPLTRNQPASQPAEQGEDLERGNAASCARDDLTLQYLPFHEPLGQAWLDQHLPTEIGRLSAR